MRTSDLIVNQAAIYKVENGELKLAVKKLKEEVSLVAIEEQRSFTPGAVRNVEAEE